MANVTLRKISDFVGADENVDPERLIILPNGVNRIAAAEAGAPPSGAYRDVAYVGGGPVNPAVGDYWVRNDAGIVNPQRRIYVCTVGGATPTWESLQGFHLISLGTSGTQTPDFSTGNFFLINGMSGNVTLANPVNSNKFDEMLVTVIQGAAGGWQITWGSQYLTNWQPNQAANSTSSIHMVRGQGNNFFPKSYSPATICYPQFSPVTVNANTTAVQNLMSWPLPAGFMNGLNRCLRFKGAGVWSTQAVSQPAIQMTVTLGGVTLLTLPSSAIAPASQISGNGWSIEGEIVTVTTGSTGTLESHGYLNIDASALGSAWNKYGDANNAASPAIDLTSAQTLQVTIAFTTNASASNSMTQRQLIVELLNAP